MARKKVLFISSEMTPFLQVTNVGDLARRLPQAIQEKDNEIRVLMPRFGCINERRNRLHEVVRLSGINITIDDNDNPLTIKVASLQEAKMQVYFLDNEDYFHRKFVYTDEKNAFFEDPTGLTSKNVASAEDLAILVNAAYQYPVIRQFTITPIHFKQINQREQQFLNSNRLVRSGDMEVLIQKTGYISEAGRCLVMMAMVNNKPYTMVFLDSVGVQSRFADAIRVKEWIQSSQHAMLRKLPNTKIAAN
jgi:hypothetical protein